MFKTGDGGQNWTRMNAGLLVTTVQALAIDPSSPATVYAGTQGGGVFKSTNAGKSWAVFNDGLTNPTVIALAIDPASNTLYAGTDGGGVFEISIRCDRCSRVIPFR